MFSMNMLMHRTEKIFAVSFAFLVKDKPLINRSQQDFNRGKSGFNRGK